MSFLDKLSSFFGGSSDDEQEAAPAAVQAPVQTAAAPVQTAAAPVQTAAVPVIKSGKSTGELAFDGAADDDTVAAILAAVSDFTDIPMNALKITSIKAI